MEKLEQVLIEKEYQLNNLKEDDFFTKKHRKLLKEIRVLKKAIKILNEATVNDANREICSVKDCR